MAWPLRKPAGAAVVDLTGPPRYTLRQWQVEDGLPQNTVNAVCQGPEGYLWLATEGGIARFDGVKFRIYDSYRDTLLLNNRFKEVAMTQDSTLWFGSSRGHLYYKQPGAPLRRYPSPLRSTILKIMPLEEDAILVCDTQGVWRIDQHGHRQIPYGGRAMLRPGGQRSFLGGREWYFYRDGQYYQPTRASLRQLPEITALYTDDEVHYWFSPNWESPRRYDLSKNKMDPIPITPQSQVRKFMRSREGVFYAAGPGGLYRLEADQWQRLPVFEAHPMPLYNLFEDHEGTLWCGGYSDGLRQLRPNPFFQLPGLDTIGKINVGPVMRSRAGGLWIGFTCNGALYLGPDGTVRRFMPMDFIDGYCVRTFHEDRQEKVWIGTDHGYAVWDARMERFHAVVGDDHWVQFDYLEVARDSVWIATQQGLFAARLGADSLEQYRRIGLSGMQVYYLLQDRRDSIRWIGTERGLYRHTPSFGLERIGKAAGVPEVPIRFIRQEADGRLWLGTYGQGLVIMEADTVHVFDYARGYPDKVVSYIARDRQGYYWLTGNQGLTQVAASELDHCLAQPKRQLRAVRYDRLDGLPTSEFNGTGKPAGVLIAPDTWLFPSLKGVIGLQASQVSRSLPTPPMVLEAVQMDGQLFDPDGLDQLPFGHGPLELQYTALSMAAPENLRFRYRLKGYQNQWEEAGTRRTAYFTNLAPGSYTFEVSASNQAGRWSPPVRWSFMIPRPFWQEAWFLALPGLMIIGLGVVMGWGITQKRLRKAQTQAALIRALPDLVMRVDRNGRTREHLGGPRAHYHHLLQSRAGVHSGQEVEATLAGRLREEVSQALQRGAMVTFEYRQPVDDRHASSIVWEGRLVPIAHQEVLCILRDITASRQARVELRQSREALTEALQQQKTLNQQLSRQKQAQLEGVVQAQEEERRRIAAELHDGIGQVVSSVRISLKDLQQESGGPDLVAALDWSIHRLDQLNSDLRNIAFNLMPSALRRFGLTTVVEELIARLQAQTSIQFEWMAHGGGDRRYPEALELSLFRAIQELINNILKHAQAGRVSVQLIDHGDSLLLMVEDDGQGFDLDAALRHGHGLINLESRIQAVQGVIAFDSAPGHGTTVSIEVPLPHDAQIPQHDHDPSPSGGG